MSQHVRRYGKYISEKIYTYRLCAFDFCKVKRGREDGLLRTMNTDKVVAVYALENYIQNDGDLLLKTLPILQNQIDALLEFQVTSAELNNGVINCSFILLFRDLIRLFACYNDGIINLLEKYFDMHKKQCREALDAYKSFLVSTDAAAPHSLNPFAAPAAQAPAGTGSARSLPVKPSDDLLGLFDPMPAGTVTVTTAYGMAPASATSQPVVLDPTNPFAQNAFQQQTASVMSPNSSAPEFSIYSNMGTTNTFGADFSLAFGAGTAATSATHENVVGFNPFLAGASDSTVPSQWGVVDEERQDAAHGQTQWAPASQVELEESSVGLGAWGAKSNESSESGDEVAGIGLSAVQQQQQQQQQQQPSDAVSSALRNPFGAMQQNAEGGHSFHSWLTVVWANLCYQLA
ncbi:unnamed protein product [Gongylonema pulchrum]|uniref:ANTH domain-containing protein n=1 Tax=Gongylonema pulchrum TaxID=637853 RepID=A0A183E7E2_9BILA|nr:unnamed protein product [Gongylonema pulchrum]